MKNMFCLSVFCFLAAMEGLVVLEHAAMGQTPVKTVTAPTDPKTVSKSEVGRLEITEQGNAQNSNDGKHLTSDEAAPVIKVLDPPEQGFFTKQLNYGGIPIKAPAVVADRALVVARIRIERLLKHLPNALYNLTVAGAELHIIGKDQVTSDLPEHRHLKGKPFDGKLTVDQRTRGLGGLLTSCGEENLLELPTDRYVGRDICTHEFAHNLQDQGLSSDVQQKLREQYKKTLEKGLWKGSYAATNEHEFFAELTMWYFGTHGDLNMTGTKPANGAEGLKAYDPESYALLDALYSGRIPIARTDKLLKKK